MDINTLARELAGLQIDSGYTFENGTRLYQALSPERAEALLQALRDNGFIVSHREMESPPIQEAGYEHDRAYQPRR